MAARPVAPSSTHRPRVERHARRSTAAGQNQTRLRMVLIAAAIVLLFGAAVRMAAVDRISPHPDEPASILAAHMVAERGVPILPSGVLYLHGATLSYLLAPFVWLGYGDLADLATMRLLSAAFGVVALLLTYLMARRMSGLAWVGVLASWLLAIDPVSVQWSAQVRMYTLLQCLAVATAWFAWRAISGPPRRGPLIMLVITFWLATATHVGAATLWPPMVAVAVLVHGRALGRQRRGLARALILTGLAPVVVSLLSEQVRPENHRGSASQPLLDFAGRSLLSLHRLQEPSLDSWLGLFGDGWGRQFAPLLMVAASGILIGRHLLREQPRKAQRISTLILLAFYWGPVLAISFFTIEQRSRYLLHVQPFGVLLISLAVAEITAVPRRRRQSSWLLEGSAALGIVAFVITTTATGLATLFQHPVIDTDYVTAMQYVAAHRKPGEPVIVALPPAAYLALGDRRGLYFLAGTAGQLRVDRYTYVTVIGRTLDYWTGSSSITDPRQLCRLVHDRPGAWIVVDDIRLSATWAYGGDMAKMISGLTEEVSDAPGRVVILRPLPEDDLPSCRRAPEPQAKVVPPLLPGGTAGTGPREGENHDQPSSPVAATPVPRQREASPEPR